MFHPTRGGTRGGQDQFKWEDVKDDKHRENYLGNSLLAPVGRWQKGRDLTWYAKDSGGTSDADSQLTKKQAEIQSIKDAEAEAMAEALGYKTKRKKETNVSEKELSSAINKTKAGVPDEHDDNIKLSSSVQGLGFNKRQGVLSGANSVSIPKGAPNRTGTVPLVPLIPHTDTQTVPKDKDSQRTKESHSSHRHRDSTRDDQDRHSRRKRSSRSASPSRKHKSSRDRGRERSRSRTRDQDRETKSRRHHERSRSRSKEREGDRHGSKSKRRTEDRRSRRESRSRSGSRERHSLKTETKDHDRGSRHRSSRRDERESDRGRSERKRSTADVDRSRSRSRTRRHLSASPPARESAGKRAN
ncbi:hypothetical protein EC957_007853 [Mortierella hygrophila]|uniref:Multiple myeloma tumor-associated protein 2-like N-terminal domain-containing protein n=1 Tax=Mortierella hygrophila TaxID=979708 RepID=A0A9P6JXU1_9FUNG|nr:hypothetical protein EC957_007853 [Mortierella hygrophila]